MWYDEDETPIGMGRDCITFFEKRYKSLVDPMLLGPGELEDMEEILVQDERIKSDLVFLFRQIVDIRHNVNRFPGVVFASLGRAYLEETCP